MISLLEPFFLQLHFMLILQHFYGLFYRLIFRDISLKSQDYCFITVIFHLIFNEITCQSSSWAIFLSYPIRIRLFIRIFIFVYLFGYNYSFIHPCAYWFSSLPLPFLSCLAILFIRLSIHSFIRCFFSLSFELFSWLYLFIHALCSC